MNVQYRIRGLKATGPVREQLGIALRALAQLVPITRATVILERQRDCNPPFQALALLGVPGPDIHAAARDYTWPAAWSKVAERLRRVIVDRSERRRARHRSGGQVHPGPRASRSAAPSPGSSGGGSAMRGRARRRHRSQY